MKVILCGACGRMGSEVMKLLISNYKGSELAAAADIMANEKFPFIYNSIDEVKEEADVIIDFSHHAATSSLTEYAIKRKLPLVIATTGQTPEELETIKEAAKHIPIFLSANMSIGVALLADLARQTAEIMTDADIEIVESHHNRKLDAPSGTALLIANEIKKVRPNAKYVYGRGGHNLRQKDEITFHSLRMGNIIGEHEVHISTDTQTIVLKHTAHSRSLFAEGAIVAANFVHTKEPGLYNMYDMISK